MSTLKFKSNIKCGACIEKVKPVLDKNSDIKSWEVDLKDPQRVLSIEADNLDVGQLKKEIEAVGYQLEDM